MAEAPPKKTSKRKGKGKAETTPIDRPKRKKIERQRLTVTTEPVWSYKDKEKLIEALHRYAPSAVESIANVIGNKTPKQVEDMINRTVNSACFSKDDRRVEFDPEKGAAPLELWLSLVHELVKADRKTDYSASYSKVLDVIARNEDLPEDSGFPNLSWSNLYCYIGGLLDDKAVQQPLSQLESLVMLDMMHNLGDTLHTSDTREQRKLLDLKYQLYRRQAETMMDGGAFTAGLQAFNNDFTDVKYTTTTTTTTTTDGADQSTAAATPSSSSTTTKSETPVTLTSASSTFLPPSNLPSTSNLPPSSSILPSTSSSSSTFLLPLPSNLPSSSSFVIHQPSTSSNSDLSSNPHQEEGDPSSLTPTLTLDPHSTHSSSSSSQISSPNQTKVSEFENTASTSSASTSSSTTTNEQIHNSSSSDSSLSFIPSTSQQHTTMKPPPPPARASTSGGVVVVGSSNDDNGIAGSSSSSVYADNDNNNDDNDNNNNGDNDNNDDDDNDNDNSNDNANNNDDNANNNANINANNNNDDNDGGFSLPEFFSLNPLTIPAHLLSFQPKTKNVTNVTIDEEEIPVVIDIKK